MPLPPSVTLTGKWKVTHEGKTDSGPLVADDHGIGVDVKKRQGLKTITRRLYVVGWDDVTSLDIRQPESNMLGGSTINAHSVTLTVSTAERTVAFALRFTDCVRVTNQLGPYAARVRARTTT